LHWQQALRPDFPQLQTPLPSQQQQEVVICWRLPHDFTAMVWPHFSASPAACAVPDAITQQHADEPGTKLTSMASVARIRAAAVKVGENMARRLFV
jgi:hypothetical protein